MLIILAPTTSMARAMPHSNANQIKLNEKNKKTKGKIIEKPGFNPTKLQETKQIARKETKDKGIELPGCIPMKSQRKIER